MKKYEYAVRNWRGNQVPNVEKYLNDFGNEGWKLVSIHESSWGIDGHTQVTAYFENEYWDDEDEDDEDDE